jgi:hypothetical protein
MYADFYNLSSMIKRLPFPRSVGDLASWYINLKQMKMQFRDRENFDEI